VQTRDDIFVFGEFRLDVKERRLWRGPALIALPPKTFDLLVVMVQDAGRLLDKDYLIGAVWPDSYVQDANLSVHVAGIRKALKPPGEAGAVIETVPKAGYRFVADVSRLPVQDEPVTRVTQPPGGDVIRQRYEPAITATSAVSAVPVFAGKDQPPRSSFRQLWLAGVVFALLTAMCTVVLVRGMGSREPAAVFSMSSHPLIGTPGLFLQPAFSPDGSELAYTWRSDADSHQRIYVQRISEDRRTLLVDTGRDDYAPAWSPDGRSIAFLHTSASPQAFELLVLDRLRRAEPRRIATVCDATDAFHGSPSLSWSPDGAGLVTTACGKDGRPELGVISAETGAQRLLTRPPAQAVDDQAVYSPDGRWIAFRRSEGDSSDDIYLVSSAGGLERKLTAQSNPIDGLAWSRDGTRILFSSAQATSQGSIWSLAISGGRPVAVTSPLTHTSSPAVALTGNRMAYVDSPNNVSVWKLSLTGGRASEPLIMSNFYDASAVYSPDGSEVAFRSDRSGANEIWLSHSDGTAARRLTHFDGPMTGSPRWSPDGRRIAFDSRVHGHGQIFVADLSSDTITCVNHAESLGSDNVVPSWSADGAAIYFSSNRTGGWQIWKHLLATGAESQVTAHGGFNAAESAGGKYLVYVGDMDSTQLRLRSLTEPFQDESLVSLGPGLWHSWTLTHESLLYLKRAPASASADLIRRNIHSGEQARIATVAQAANDSLSVSPDQRTLLYAHRANTGSSIMITDGWH
jgi:Tol biopolymer transport system component/DNA-binding winged helix-turn-helix (wHTH) protein